MKIRESIEIVEGMMLGELTGYKGSDEFQTFLASFKPIMGMTSAYRRRSILNGFLDYLADRGYTKLMHGTFGAVFTHPGVRYAIKVFKHDPGYMRFLKIALADQGNPLFPKFRGKFMRIQDDYYVVRMELLEPLDDTPHTRATHLLLALAGNRPWDSPEAFLEAQQSRLERKGFRDLPAAIARSLNELREDTSPLQTMMFLFDQRAGLAMDLESRNFMLRGDQLVVIDPYYDQESVD